MARLLELPPYILNHILDLLSRKEHHALAHACQAANKEVTPRLYRDLRFTATGSGSCARRLVLLFRSLVERPTLASHVASLRLLGAQHCWNVCNPWPGEVERRIRFWGLDDCPTLSRAQLIFASNMFYSFVDNDMQQSQPQFRQRAADAIATLVLTRLTDLRHLESGEGFLRYSLFLPQVLKRTDSLFPKLHHVVLGDKGIDIRTSVAYMDLHLIRPVFYSSTITSFECSMTQPWRFQWPNSVPPETNTLTSLTLFRTHISRATLGALLSATPCLRSLYFEHEFPFTTATPTSPPLHPYLNLDELNTALFPVRATLESCTLILRLTQDSITTTAYPLSSIRFPPIQGTLTMLKYMPRLTRVSVPLTMLLGWFPTFAARLDEVLPHSLEHLTLRDDLVRYCPWVAPANAEIKVRRIREYIQGRDGHAAMLRELMVRLTSAKRSLGDAVGALSARGGRGCKTSVVRGRKSVTYGWVFNKGMAGPVRKDSVFRPMSPLVEAEGNFL